MGKWRLREGGAGLGPQREMRVVLRVSQALTNFFVTQCSHWELEDQENQSPLMLNAGLGVGAGWVLVELGPEGG